VEEVAEENGTVSVKTTRGVIRAQHAVVATNSSISDRFAIHTKTAPYRTYVITFDIKRGALPDALYWDTEDPYHYVRLQPGPRNTDYVLVGGEDHKSGEADDADERFRKLEAWARDLISGLGKVEHRRPGRCSTPSITLALSDGTRAVKISTSPWEIPGKALRMGLRAQR
jgi:glycine/D-amino acid oxidase-like deaminating enzyme